MPSRRAIEALALRRGDPLYPAGLLDLADPPEQVFVRGARIPCVLEAVAMVGSRAASPYGKATAERIAADLARLGRVVVSGLARGVDAAAHRGALAAGGATWAVLPGALDRVAPAHHAELAEAVAERGGLLTEIAHGGPGHRGAFVARNRLIAALASATVVVEAAERSGALATAAAARRLGRPVLAVPGDVDRPTARGCHELLRRGALLCEGVADVERAIERWAMERSERASARGDAATRRGPARDLPRAARGRGARDEAVENATPAARLMRALAREPRALEPMAAQAGLSVPEALAALLALQWAGVAVALPGQRWARRNR